MKRFGEEEIAPAIKNLVYTMEHSLSFLGGDRNSIDLVPVKIVQRAGVAAQLFELGNATNADDLFVILTNPEGQWCAPIPIPIRPQLVRDAITQGREPYRWLLLMGVLTG